MPRMPPPEVSVIVESTHACAGADQDSVSDIAESIPCMIGMSRDVPDATAIAFAAGFYEELAFGKTLLRRSSWARFRSS